MAKKTFFVQIYQDAYCLHREPTTRFTLSLQLENVYYTTTTSSLK